MAEASCPRAHRYVLRVRGRFGPGHQGGRECGGVPGNTSQAPLLTYMSIKSRLQGFALKLATRSIKDEGKEASDSLGTLHFSDWVPFEHNHLGFFTIFDGDFAKYIQDFADKTSMVFDAVFPHVDGRAANPSSEERPGVLSVGIGGQPSAHRVLQRLSGTRGSRHPSPAGRLSHVTTDHRWLAVAGRHTVTTMFDQDFGAGQRESNAKQHRRRISRQTLWSVRDPVERGRDERRTQ